MKTINYKKGYLLLICLLSVLISCTNKPKEENTARHQDIYTCPMHPQIIRDHPGDCPICGMALVKKGGTEAPLDSIGLETLLKPSDRFVISSIPVTTISRRDETIGVEALGVTAYNTNLTGSISARTGGRIEKLYLKYNFQDVKKGQKVMEIYSPELLTAQENLLFILKNDPSNASLISAAEQKLMLLGFPTEALTQLIKTGKTSFTVPVFSNYSGHIHDVEQMPEQPKIAQQSAITSELMIKEGMYVTKGQALFKVYNPDRLWVLLNIYPDQQELIRKGQEVILSSPDYPGKIFNGRIEYIEPFFREGSKTLTVRAIIENQHQVQQHIPVGVQFKAMIPTYKKNADWLPQEAVLSLGMDKVVFIKEGAQFKVRRVETGYKTQDKIQILKGLTATDSVASDAQFLMDSEGFIKINQ
ncbi:MAG TPA: copper transporter [Sphingobacteriaceae bacterium]|nr:copper transporter [Sphingobacteriaceae bacterium]